MHNSYFLYKQLAPRLHTELTGHKLAACFSQQKDELILQFTSDHGRVFNIVAHLNSTFTCLAFPEEISAARRNKALLFDQLLNKQVTAVSGFAYERAFVVAFEEGYKLLFKMFGRQANIILFKTDQPVTVFKHNLPTDLHFDLATLSSQQPQTEQEKRALAWITLDKATKAFIEQQIKDLPADEAAREKNRWLQQLANPTAYYLIEQDNLIRFSLLPNGPVLHSYDDILVALTAFFKQYLTRLHFNRQQQQLKKELQKDIRKTEAYLTKTRQKLQERQSAGGYQLMADLLMANLHRIPAGSKAVQLPDFYSGREITIKLNPQLSPQKNAEKYYQKAKNLHVEIAKLREALAAKERHLHKLRQQLADLENARSVRDLKSVTKEKQPARAALPYREFMIDGYQVRVGKSARHNDDLTLHYAGKNDLFFHARDVAGSHVILKVQGNKPVPKPTLEKVAALAAWYSKRKTDSLCPVAYTQRKYVRKPKGAPPGTVVMEREKVLLVKPELPD